MGEFFQKKLSFLPLPAKMRNKRHGGLNCNVTSREVTFHGSWLREKYYVYFFFRMIMRLAKDINLFRDSNTPTRTPSFHSLLHRNYDGRITAAALTLTFLSLPSS